MSSINITLSDTEFRSKLDQLMLESSMLMEDISDVEKEASVAEDKVKQLKIATDQELRTMLVALRRTATLYRGFAQATGSAMNEVYSLGIEAALLTAELIFDIAVAESLTVALAFQSAAKFAMVAALIARANALRNQQARNAEQFQGIITMISVFTY